MDRLPLPPERRLRFPMSTTEPRNPWSACVRVRNCMPVQPAPSSPAIEAATAVATARRPLVVVCE